MCGVNTKSTILIKAIKRNNDVKLLTKQEIDILAERFEIGGRVHYGHFIQFFKEMNNQKSFNRQKSYKAVDGSVQTRSTRPKQSVGLSPFRMSSEWASLKEDVFKNKTYKLNDTSSKPLESVSEKGRNTYTNKSSTDNRNGNNKNQIEMLNENEYEDEESYDASSPQTSLHTKDGKQKQKQNNFRERVRDRRENRNSSGHDEWRESRDGNLSSSPPSDSKSPVKPNSGERGRSQKTSSLNNSDLPDTSIKKNVPPPKPARNTPGKKNDALVEKSPKKNNNEKNKNNRDRDNDDSYDKNDNRNSNKNKNSYNNNNDNNNDYDDDDDNDDNYYNRNTSDKKRNIISGSELDFKSDVRGRSGSPLDLRDRNRNQNQDNEYDNRRRRDSENDRGRGSERGRRSPNEAKNIPSIRSRSPDGRSSPENVAVNRRSWRRSLTDSMMWSKSQTMLVDNNDVQGPLKLPQRAQSPDGKGVTKYFPWNRRSNGDSGRSSPVAL